MSLKPVGDVFQVEWRPVVGLEGYYEVSSQAEIRSIPHPSRRLSSPHVLKRQLNHGYWVVVYRRKNERKTKTMLCHREFAKAFIPNPLKLPEVNHVDGVTTNNSLENLEWCTHAENVQHAFKTHLVSIGEERTHSKLSSNVVRDIRKKYSPRIYSSYRLAKEYGVTQTAVMQVLKGKTWKEVV